MCLNIVLHNQSDVPIFKQIIKALKEAIYQNELQEGEMLPSVRALANDLKISFLTVKRAYDELEAEGFIRTLPGKGSLVAPKNMEFMREEKLKEIQGYFEKIDELSKVAGISKAELKELFDIIFEEEN